MLLIRTKVSHEVEVELKDGRSWESVERTVVDSGWMHFGGAAALPGLSNESETSERITHVRLRSALALVRI